MKHLTDVTFAFCILMTVWVCNKSLNWRQIIWSMTLSNVPLLNIKLVKADSNPTQTAGWGMHPPASLLGSVLDHETVFCRNQSEDDKVQPAVRWRIDCLSHNGMRLCLSMSRVNQQVAIRLASQQINKTTSSSSITACWRDDWEGARAKMAAFVALLFVVRNNSNTET